MNLRHLLNLSIISFIHLLAGIHKTHAGEGLTAYSFLFGMGGSDDVQQIHFKPDDGLRFRKKYEAKHGPRGQYLIEKLGQGYSDEGPSILDPDQTITKPPKKKSKRNKTKPRSAGTTETTTTDVPSTTVYDSTTNTEFYDSTVETTYDLTTVTDTPHNNDDYYYYN